MVMVAILINGPWPFVQIFNPLLKKIGPGASEKMFKGVDDGRTEDDGRQVITIAHPEPSAQVS